MKKRKRVWWRYNELPDSVQSRARELFGPYLDVHSSAVAFRMEAKGRGMFRLYATCRDQALTLADLFRA